MRMRFISLCSGIEAASVAFKSLGWDAIAFSEIDAFPSAVLAHHYPSVPNLGDMTKFKSWPEQIFIDADAIVGGPPCQAFSVAGKRASLDDERGNLTLIYTELIDHADRIRISHGRPAVVCLYENVPGILSTKDNAFGCFLAQLCGGDEPLNAPDGWPDAGCVSGPSRTAAWRVLDAQYFGLPQRRRRVFVVASARNDFDPAAVLFEFDGVRRDSAPRREAGQAITGTLSARTEGGGGLGTDFGIAGGVQPVAGTLCIATGQGGAEIGAEIAPTLNCNHEAPYIAKPAFAAAFKGGQGSAAGSIGYSEHVAPTLSSADSGSNRTPVVLTHAIAFGWQNSAAQGDSCSEYLSPTLDKSKTPAIARAVARPMTHIVNGNSSPEVSTELAFPLRANDGSGNRQALAHAMQVRRLTPRECERLQGFPDVVKSVKILACLDHQNPSVFAETQYPKSQNNAKSAEPGVLLPSVSVAGQSSSTSHPSQKERVAVNVQINLERMHLQLFSAEKLLLSVNLAESQNRYPLFTQLANIAPLLALVLGDLERKTIAGKEVSHPNINPSSHQRNGSPFVELSGQEISEFANDAGMFTEKVNAFTKFITSQAGQNSLSCSETLRILCCFVMTAISSCIQETTNWASSYEISIDLAQGYTAVPNRGKPAADGPRYKALGNSWAVPVVAWIGKRIKAAL